MMPDAVGHEGQGKSTEGTGCRPIEYGFSSMLPHMRRRAGSCSFFAIGSVFGQ